MINPAQPSEGILDPQQPYWPADKVGEITWLRLKGKLTGRRVEGLSENFTSYVKLGDADADRLIANIKKYGQYPQVNQNDKYGGAYNNEAYQKWLVEEFLEKPFREETDKKIEEAVIERRVKEIQEKKKEIADTLNNKPQPEVQPQDKLLPADPLDIPDPWEGSETVPNIVTPVTTEPTLLLPPAKDPEPEVEKPQQEKKQKKEKSFIIPETLSPEVRTTIRNFAGNLDSIRRQMSKQTRILQRREGNYRRIINGLESSKFLLGQQVENYREALDDLETQQRIAEAYSAPIGPQPMESPTPWAAAGPEDAGNEQGFTPRLPAEKLSQGGFLNTPYPGRFAEGGVNVAPNFAEKMLQPGIYDNPTIGTLPPNSAVIPLNRNSGKELMGQYDTQQYVQALGETMFKPINALLGGALANLGDILRDLGPFAGYFSAGLKSLLNPLSSLLKLPANIILDILGTQKDEDGERSSFYKMWKQLLVDNNLIFPGSSIKDLDKEQLEGEIAKDIYGIGPKGEGLRYIGGTNVSMSNLPAWIPMPKSEYGKVGYVSGFGSRWGRQHLGIDLDGDPGIKIISPFAGTVYDLNRGAVEGDKGAGGGYGNLVGIEHDQPKIFTFYGHLKDVSNSLKIGSKVSAGEVIGTMGNTGHSYGSHLHWEVRQSKHGGQIDPAAWTRSVNKPAPAAAEPKDGDEEKDKKNKPQPSSARIPNANAGPASPGYGDKESGGTVGKFEKGGFIKPSISSSPTSNIIPEKTKSFAQPKVQTPKLQRTITTPVATPTKIQPKVYNIQAPQTGPSIQMMPTSTLKPQFIMIDIPTNSILESNEIRRMM